MRRLGIEGCGEAVIAVSWVAAIAIALTACSTGPGDAPTDQADAGQVAVDANTPDSSMDDAGRMPDSGTTADAGESADAGEPSDAGATGDAGAPLASVCATRSAEIAASTGATIFVSPASDGLVSVGGGGSRSLREVVSGAAEGTTILLEDGTYLLPEAQVGGYSGLYFTTANVTLRGASGDPHAVIIDSAYRDHGGSTAPITVAAAGVVLADFTVQRSIFHLIHLWAAGDDALIHRVRLVDGGQQFLKASPGSDERVDDVEVSCSQFLMSDDGRDNVWGYGQVGGNTACYTGGIDTHESRRWWVHDSRFEGIYCEQGGPQRPVHGRKADVRGGLTYTGGLSEHAVHMWDAEPGGGHRIERNTIVNCARGIGLGFRTETYDTVIQNNIIFSRFPGGPGHDVGISVERAHNTQVDNNTVFFSASNSYSSTIEYRYASTADLSIRNNLTNRRIRSRNDATASLLSNVSDAAPEWFVDATQGDLHLATCDIPRVSGAGESLPGVQDDIDQQPRGASNDIGADQCSP